MDAEIVSIISMAVDLPATLGPSIPKQPPSNKARQMHFTSARFQDYYFPLAKTQISDYHFYGFLMVSEK